MTALATLIRTASFDVRSTGFAALARDIADYLPLTLFVRALRG